MVTAMDKLENDRDSIKATIVWLETKLAAHAAVPLNLSQVDKYMQLNELSETKLIEVFGKIVSQAPADIGPDNIEHFILLDRVLEVQFQLQAIKEAFVPVVPVVPVPKPADIRLPKIELPKFDGNIQNWISFHDMFCAAIHNNPSLTNAQKLTYLKSALTGEAARQVKSIAVTDDNYDTAWTQLSSRYHNERELLFAILRRFNSQPITQSNSATAIRSLVDVSKECFRSLEALKLPVDQWDALFLFYMFSKLDQASRELWEQTLTDSAIPPLKNFLDFLEQRARALAAGGIPQPRVQAQGGRPDHGNSPRRVAHVHHVPQTPTCKLQCEVGHPLFRCERFLAMPIPERFETARRLSICFNCLRDGHSTAQCPSQRFCRTCNGKHNTLLHKPRPANPGNAPVLANNAYCNDGTLVRQTLLATAIIKVFNHLGQHQIFRVLCDGGSTASFITEACVNKLRLRRLRNTAEILGLASVHVGNAKGITAFSIQSYYSDEHEHAVEALITPKITCRLPIHSCDPQMWPHLDGLRLADPQFHEPADIDILLGADIFYELLTHGKRTGPPGSPIALNSTLGWLVAGKLNSTQFNSPQVYAHHTEVDLDQRLQQFWEIETVPSTRTMTVEEKKCEAHFDETHEVLESGRFRVQLPFKHPRPVLGSSREIAIRRLKQLEGRFSREPGYQSQYREFMDEYLSLGHMEEVPVVDRAIQVSASCYLPHHFVLKQSSTTTKFRVVFDASASTSTSVSLNDSLMVGPTIQDLLADILSRFRIHPVAFTADIAKMYRQILVTESDANMQRIVWRNSPTDPIKDYRLLTVTYGTASAPYLATKALQQLATNQRESLPLAYEIAMNDFYVDDVMSGDETDAKAIEATTELREMVERGGMELRKFCSNSVALLQTIPIELRETNPLLPLDDDGHTVKALGVYWNPVRDVFSFKVTLDSNVPNTKRKLLSEIAKIFDPLGWLAPAIIRAKMVMQQLWKLDLGWDESLPDDIQQEWSTYRLNLLTIEELSIPRCMIPPGYTRLYLVGFCDASEKAYAAVVYLCAYKDGRNPVVSLIASKTRVAPTKVITLPRLELCGAVLLAQLITSTQHSLKLNFNSITAWTDSTIVLAYIQAHPSRWATFVANRVTEIQERLPEQHWGHVSGTENPADCASRGLDPSELKAFDLWWNGPNWLRVEASAATVRKFTPDFQSNNLEHRRAVIVCGNIVTSDQSLLHTCSSLRTIKRVTAWILRYVHNLRIKVQTKKKQFPCLLSQHGPLSAAEIDNALLTWVRVVQQEHFTSEIKCLERESPLPVKSPILSLNPFLDSCSLLRVGGRLRNAPLPVDQRQPLLLPRHHRLTQLLIMNEHLDNLHAGPQLLGSILHKRFWIVGSRDAIRHQLKKCVVCARNAALTMQQFMGNLPSVRVTPAKPFLKSGVDYAGPFSIRPITKRSKTTLKAYLAIFVCFTTHAIHLEVVSDLSTPAFIAALHRFISRRGKPSDIYSDCGTNFVGAAREIKEATALFNSSKHNQVVADQFSNHGLQWHFNPPGAPHFGGLWEAGVKSVKYHLRRVVGLARLTFEELTTVMTQIEACLNSRPLTPLSTDPGELTALTPGHFLIGSPLTALPEPDWTTEKSTRLSRWQLLQQIKQHFWKRWANEFISRQQQRPKWMKLRSGIKVNDLVIIKDDRLPPLQWKLGRVIELHSGDDGLTRVVTLRTAEGDLKRPIVKLCLLPMDPASTEENAENPDIGA